MNIERRGRRPSAAKQPINQLPWSQPQLTLEPARILSDDQIEAIHRQSLQVLEEIGMDILYAEARDILARAGARVDGERVRIGREIVEHALHSSHGIHHPCTQSQPQHSDRRQVDRVRAGRRPTQLLRP